MGHLSRPSLSGSLTDMLQSAYPLSQVTHLLLLVNVLIMNAFLSLANPALSMDSNRLSWSSVAFKHTYLDIMGNSQSIRIVQGLHFAITLSYTITIPLLGHNRQGRHNQVWFLTWYQNRTYFNVISKLKLNFWVRLFLLYFARTLGQENWTPFLGFLQFKDNLNLDPRTVESLYTVFLDHT